MGKFKVGDKCVPVKGACNTFDWTTGAEYVIITEDFGDDYRYDIYNGQNEKIEWCLHCLNDDNMTLYQRDMDNLQVGDILTQSNFHDECKVMAISGELLGLSHNNNFEDFDRWYSLTHIKEGEWTLKGSEPEQKEITIEEIAKLMNVPVEQVRIKDK